MPELILVAEDERDLLTTLDYNLRREGFETRLAQNGREALDAIAQDPVPDLILLDIMLPDISGTEVCRRVRASARTRDVPVVMVTAKSAEIDRVVGFEIGADDYVVKPFSVRELMLRVRAILRRAEHKEQVEGPVEFGSLRLDPDAHRVWVDDVEIALTPLEFRLLSTFLNRRGRAQSRDTLLTDVWGIEADITTRTVNTHVKRLREKIGPAGQYIETLRGVGYRFRAEPDEEE